jgi:hypothetical protein
VAPARHLAAFHAASFVARLGHGSADAEFTPPRPWAARFLAYRPACVAAAPQAASTTVAGRARSKRIVQDGMAYAAAAGGRQYKA